MDVITVESKAFKELEAVYFGLIVPLFSVKPCHYNS